MKIVIAPDSFKGSLSALDAAEAMKRGALLAFPDAEIRIVPLADGGEGTVDALVAAIPGSMTIEATVTGPLGSLVVARYGLLGEDREIAVVEMAAASGLTLIASSDRNPMLTTTYGTGELIHRALATEGVGEIIIGLGGSATNDGGIGALQPLGIEFTDLNGAIIRSPAVGGDVRSVSSFSTASVSLPSNVKVTLACDVTNPLCGPLGASAVFGPQKGATPSMVADLDDALAKFATTLNSIAETRNNDLPAPPIESRPGSGAAGGLAAGLMAIFPQAILKPGIEIVLDAVNFTECLSGASLVLTGEGKLDSQTLGGKAIDGVLRRAYEAGVPAIVFAGVVEEGVAEALAPRGLSSAHGLMEIAVSVDDAMENSARLLELLVATVLSANAGA